jgi:hypothetical protein
METPEVKYEEILITRHYLIVTYRADTPITYQVYEGGRIYDASDYFQDGEDYDGNKLTHKFFLLPLKGR